MNQLHVRTVEQVNKDINYEGRPGPLPLVCKAAHKSDDPLEKAKATAQKALGLYCDRTSQERCTTEAECLALGGRPKAKYCTAAAKGSGEKCVCCKDIGTNPGTRT